MLRVRDTCYMYGHRSSIIPSGTALMSQPIIIFTVILFFSPITPCHRWKDSLHAALLASFVQPIQVS
ncbi:hypothetical protein M405DRAFT_31903 [Rhizopogon salebrosus TDB-379]|nr:hypothetical protein M405DRAFT_31903 [Rhizopogon salebrosus TDB-379]